MTDRMTRKRALNAAGFYHLKSGWVHEDDYPDLQAQIYRAVKAAADEVAQHTGGRNE